MVSHLLSTCPGDFLPAWLQGKYDVPTHTEGLLAFVSSRPTTRTRASTARAAQLLGLGFLEIPWDGFYGNPEQHDRFQGFLKAELLSLKNSGVRALIIRLGQQKSLEELAFDDGPIVLNGCTNLWHPTQSLADLRSLYEAFGSLNNRTIGFVGNGESPVLASLAADAALLGCRLRLIGPFPPRKEVCQLTEKYGTTMEHETDVKFINGCDALYVDEWHYRRLTEAEQHELLPYRITAELLDKYPTCLKLLHCLPFGYEINGRLFDSDRSLVWQQVAWRPKAIAAYISYAFKTLT
jgi:ornithine carbamoyltransferase